MILRALCYLFGLFLLPATALASSLTLDELLSRSAPPPGVVFEIVDRDPRALDVALPWVRQAAQKLKHRFPGMPMAVVTHGREMFALQGDTQERQGATHQLARSLSREEGIPVHVCETYAGWKGISAEAFPDYVDVAPSGPAQIRNYEALDYLRLVVPRATELRQADKAPSRH